MACALFADGGLETEVALFLKYKFIYKLRGKIKKNKEA